MSALRDSSLGGRGAGRLGIAGLWSLATVEENLVSQKCTLVLGVEAYLQSW